MSMDKYDHQAIEGKWQKKWEKTGLNITDLAGAKKPFYNLMMFPYPSAEGLHVGNTYAFIASDVYGRFKKLSGYDVFEPIGLDGFGIHSENYSLKVGKHPMDNAKVTEERFYRQQLAKIGNMYDWSRCVETYKPNYYRWTQWLFVKMFKAGLAYRDKAEVNWCPSCKTVLSDEQVIDGKCERCSTAVIKKELEQWFFRITKYAERLLEGHKKIDWSEKVKIAQKNWIGKKEGINITYDIDESTEKVTIFTTRPDTNFGATFIVLAPEHLLVSKITTDEYKKAVENYIVTTKEKSETERMAEGRKKSGVFTGMYAINQLTGYKMPIWVADFVLMGFGTGAVVGVPGHDLRDFEFAQEFGLEIIRVVVGNDGDTTPITKVKQVQEEEGIMVNSGFLNGLDIHEATRKIMDYIVEKGWGNKITTYHLRDWLISRQRYWGPPIPMISCPKCGWQPVPEDQLPVLLPQIADYQPEGEGKGPLAKHPDFYETRCPKCGGKATRETDVSDTFLDSAWYELRYPSVGVAGTIKNGEELPWDEKLLAKWLPVNMYTGGPEHSVLHLMYFRFVAMALYDMGYLPFAEPCEHFFAHGMIIKDGAKMSKSKGNVVNPDEYIAKFGADTLRLYLMFMGPIVGGGDFRDSGMEGMQRWISRVYHTVLANLSNLSQEPNSVLDKEISKLIKKAEADFESRHYNTTIAKMMELVNLLTSNKLSMTTDQIKKFLIVLAPLAPHLAEELWERLGNTESVHKQTWPEYDESKLTEDKVTIVVQVNGKVRGRFEMEANKATDQDYISQLARASAKVKNYLTGASYREIFVPSKLINFVG